MYSGLQYVFKGGLGILRYKMKTKTVINGFNSTEKIDDN
jgi:hypothetical protein